MLKWLKKVWKSNDESQQEFDIKINKEELPNHIAVIMDGNGRWAEKKDLVRTKGHQQGVNTLKEIVKTANQLGIEYFSAYAFSTENWKRPQEEVEFLMDLFKDVFAQEIDTFKQENIKVNVIGYKDRLPESVSKRVNRIVAETKENTGLKFNIALDYGGQAEIVESTKKIIKDVKADKLTADELTAEKFSEYLYTSGQKDVDLLIRPGGERRISNFLLWQIAYAELYFTNTYWPDFDKEEFKSAIKEYQRRNRRFGGIKGK